MFLKILQLLSETPLSSALICDYGEERAFGDSFRGVRKQKLIKGNDILHHTGDCDLTSYVNFKMLQSCLKAYEDLKFGGLISQGQFLKLLHVEISKELLLKQSTSQKDKEYVEWSYKKIVDDTEMGKNYKFMYIHKKKVQPVYPFVEEILEMIEKQNL
jgi:SAM-dependent MidA family methyltransferase